MSRHCRDIGLQAPKCYFKGLSTQSSTLRPRGGGGGGGGCLGHENMRVFNSSGSGIRGTPSLLRNSYPGTWDATM